MSRLLFEWGPEKADANRRKHGVAFEEAATIFADYFNRTVPDPEHSSEEDRFVTIGFSAKQQVLTVVHTDRGGCFRLISARKASRKERIQYEEGTQQAG